MAIDGYRSENVKQRRFAIPIMSAISASGHNSERTSLCPAIKETASNRNAASPGFFLL
jgi:hypothetical protein